MLAQLLFATAATAAALPASKVQVARDAKPTVWTAPGGSGNTQVIFSDDKINIGTCSLDDIINSLYTNCYDEGTCDPSGWQTDAKCWYQDNSVNQIQLSAATSDYQEWIKNGLIEAIQAAMGTDGVVKTEQVTTDAEETSGTPGTTPIYGHSITLTYLPASISITHQNDNAPPDVISLALASPSSNYDGKLCSTLTTIGSSVAGAVNGAAGGIFSLLSLACGS